METNKKQKSKYAYIVYYVDTQKNDIKYINEFNDTETLANYYNLANKKSIYHYIHNNIDTIDLSSIKNLLQNKYIVFKELNDF